MLSHKTNQYNFFFNSLNLGKFLFTHKFLNWESTFLQRKKLKGILQNSYNFCTAQKKKKKSHALYNHITLVWTPCSLVLTFQESLWTIYVLRQITSIISLFVRHMWDIDKLYWNGLPSPDKSRFAKERMRGKQNTL